MGENILLSDIIKQCFHRHEASLYMFGEINPKNLQNMGFGGLVRKHKILRRKCDLFHGETHFEMHTLDPEIRLFENTCFVQGYTPLILTTCLVILFNSTLNNPLLTNL